MICSTDFFFSKDTYFDAENKIKFAEIQLDSLKMGQVNTPYTKYIKFRTISQWTLFAVIYDSVMYVCSDVFHFLWEI